MARLATRITTETCSTARGAGNKLGSVLFQAHGCIYYKTDLIAKGDTAQSLEATVAGPGGSTKLNPSLIEKFALGPLTQAVLWEDERATMSLDRGPCRLRVLL